MHLDAFEKKSIYVIVSVRKKCDVDENQYKKLFN